MAIPGKENENGVYEFPYMIKPPEKTKWEAVKTAIWDPSTKAFLGRTGKSWAQILLFYTIFYIALAALFAICMAGLYGSLNDDRPTYTNVRSLIGTNPGLGFRPIPDTEEGALIWYSVKNETSQKKYINLLNDFLKGYNKTKPGRESKLAAACDYNTTNTTNTNNTDNTIQADGKACPVNITAFGDCNGPKYGYDTRSPCIFLKLNKIYDWVPHTYRNDTVLPGNMPDHVKEGIMMDMGKGKNDTVWVSCEGEYPADKEHLNNGFEYYPQKGFPAYYYPFQHKKDEYLSPLVAVQIVKPKLGVLLNIECRAWAANIEYAGGMPEMRKGSVHFEIMIDE